jgi:hypothetical protein
MTVAELIQKLKKMPLDADVVSPNYSNITKVEILEPGREVVVVS